MIDNLKKDAENLLIVTRTEDNNYNMMKNAEGDKNILLSGIKSKVKHVFKQILNAHDYYISVGYKIDYEEKQVIISLSMTDGIIVTLDNLKELQAKLNCDDILIEYETETNIDTHSQMVLKFHYNDLKC